MGPAGVSGSPRAPMEGRERARRDDLRTLRRRGGQHRDRAMAALGPLPAPRDRHLGRRAARCLRWRGARRGRGSGPGLLVRSAGRGPERRRRPALDRRHRPRAEPNGDGSGFQCGFRGGQRSASPLTSLIGSAPAAAALSRALTLRIAAAAGGPVLYRGRSGGMSRLALGQIAGRGRAGLPLHGHAAGQRRQRGRGLVAERRLRLERRLTTLNFSPRLSIRWVHGSDSRQTRCEAGTQS